MAAATGLWQYVGDRERVKDLVSGAGSGAPLIFVLIQSLQVVLAPVPGEATGFIGGYLFGVLPGFAYSTVGLTLGSWANLFLGRVLGRRYVRRLVPRRQLKRFDAMIRHKGLMVVFLLFVFPGFPKDYLCLFLGMSELPIRVLLLLSCVGRSPGTLVLSLQGALLSEGDYFLLCLAVAVFAATGGVFYLCRHRFYRWVEKVEERQATGR